MNALLLVITGVLVLLLGAVMESTAIGAIGVIVLIAAAENAWRDRRADR